MSQNFGGQISVESTLNKETTVRFWLPAAGESSLWERSLALHF